ncbi:MAG: 23S rRNA (pseudouridine(1915)-N(3))-methyltransferase RlmH, partial [Clostridia bacterium]|nr:23S rRNA (pseudouridine(1915)-N(3))-methyltransferase RlmH [Clostridia bacterium]
MNRIRILCVGKLKDRCWIEAAAEYEKRLARFCPPEIVELPDERAPETLSAAQERQILRREGERILNRIGERAHVIALCVDGRPLSSEAFAARLGALLDGGRTVEFVIGGSLGLDAAVLARADERLSVSAMT